jgi:hypothetical protein
MGRVMRMSLVVGLALAFAGVPSRLLAQEEAETIPRGPTPEVVKESQEARPPAKDGVEPGAASAEPEQEVGEDPGAKAYRDWVESIWSAP